MDILWSPWRYDYIRSNEKRESGGASDCVFCEVLQSPAADDEKFIVHRAGFNFVILNIFPYITGHLMIVPFEHLPAISQASKESTDELMDLIKRSQEILGEVYRPNGFNIGMNLGKAAGAGVEEHFHMHVMPRWTGDSNFMTTVAETRTIPETLEKTYEKLKGRF
ncbi:MAG: HIT domain-containing protein [Acidobacteria bacterium]|nr:MAG: HIT domain-containing protein [Acidobacteriota bacterium]REK01797.1 MAG: HIT domain-containing protein [Acidobacteriota bacterium]REK14753.1 MAG: HIT domain-containing protein [Acidobacteriota bacterium]REK45468.1 MAG: HIT domain-containing protein [Acidobacteriota bacterium]